jgi:hypothetical protein
MPGRRVMGGRMAAWGVVAAADVPARLAHAQMNPARAGGQALLAAGNRLGELEAFDRVEVRAGSHDLMVAAAGPEIEVASIAVARGVQSGVQVEPN